ncbi:MAG: ATP-binding protein [Clostridiales bacterium]|jgi:predicted AAA+ superfamily ATPase|nr:ATP-binding protein [Clostridiales bacterium]
MKRLIEDKLIAWKNRPNKMPLLLFGARQVGKTTTVIDFGKAQYSNTVVFNLESNEALQNVFDGDLSPARIISELETYSGQSLQKGATLIFFDEIQACPKALTALKYFCEEAPRYHIAAAGSLLGVALNRGRKKQDDSIAAAVSYPVGKVEILTMFPMTFEEFLLNVNPLLSAEIKKRYESLSPLSEIAHKKALELFRAYLYTGGMPQAVFAYCEQKDLDAVRIRQNEIHALYSLDMAKYTTAAEQIKIKAIYASVPAQLAKENKKFQYSLIKSGARAAAYEEGLEWLAAAGLIIKCGKAGAGRLPLSSYIDLQSYKIYLSDVGLLNAKGNIPKNIVLTQSGLGGEAKGAMTENYVAQELVAGGHTIAYWESQGKAEVDFLIQTEDGVIPVEVKAQTNTQAKSLKEYVCKFDPKYSIRISAKNFGFENDIKSIPLYAVFCLKP